MTKYLVNFNVTLEDNTRVINMFRAMTAKDNDELLLKIKALNRIFRSDFDEIWVMSNYWPLPDSTPMLGMNKFFLSDQLIGWKK